MNLKKILITLSFLATFIFGFVSCNLITDPDRYIDNSVIPPSQGVLQFSELSSGQHIDGIIRFTVDTSGLGFTPNGIGIFIDEQEITRYQNINQIIQIDARARSEGLHTIGIGFYNEKPNHGLLNLVYIPSVYLETELYFDHTLPAELTISATEEENGFTKISWNVSPNENFLKYEVLKSFDGINWQILKTIENKGTTSLIDSAEIILSGLEVNYKLKHYTGFTSQESNTLNHIVGDKIEYDIQIDISKYGLITNPSLNDIYFMVDKKIVAFSATDNSFRKEMLLSDIPSSNPFASFAVSDDGQKIFVYNNYGRKLYILNANTLNIIVSKRLNVPEELRMESDQIISVDENRFLLFAKYDKIRFVNFNQNIFLDSLVIPNVEIYSATTSLDKSKLIISIRDNNQNPNVYKIQVRDLNAAGFPVLYEIIDEPSYKLSISPDGSKLYELPSQSNKINIRDINSLSIIQTLVSAQNQRIFNYTISDNKIYTCQNYNINLNGTTQAVYQVNRYSTGSHTLETSQYIKSVWVYNMALSGNNIYFPSSSFLDSKNIIGLLLKQ